MLETTTLMYVIESFVLVYIILFVVNFYSLLCSSVMVYTCGVQLAECCICLVLLPFRPN